MEKSPASLVGISVHPGEAVRQGALFIVTKVIVICDKSTGMQGPRDLDQPLALALATLVFLQFTLVISKLLVLVVLQSLALLLC